MPTIAVIEDEAAIRDMYLFKLKHHGYQTISASDGVEGLELIERLHPDLILLDLKMPNMDGTEMLRQLRGQQWGESTITIILTNISQSEAPMELRFLNVEKYIVKAHTTPAQVIQEVTETLKRHNKIPAEHPALAGQKGTR